MPQIVQKGKKNMMYCSCDYCDSYISFYISEISQHTEDVFGYIHVYDDIKCPSCKHEITVIYDGKWEDGVTKA